MTPTIESRLRSVFASVLGIDGGSLDRSSSPESIVSWDSVNHLSLMMAVEADLGVQFEPTEMLSLQSFGAILDRVSAPNAN